MLEDALIALASAGGTTLVSAMVSDSWEGIKSRFLRIFGQGSPSELQSVEARLEDSRKALVAQQGAASDSARAEQVIEWRTRLRDLMENDPRYEAEVRSFIEDARGQIADSVGKVEQQAAAFDHAQQAVQGQGTQNVIFGSHGTDARG